MTNVVADLTFGHDLDPIIYKNYVAGTIVDLGFENNFMLSKLYTKLFLPTIKIKHCSNLLLIASKYFIAMAPFHYLLIK